MLDRRTRWRDLTRGQRRVVVASAVVQVALQGATLWDLRRRSADELRGSKGWWTLAAFVNVLGPIAYLAVGRRRGVRDGGRTA